MDEVDFFCECLNALHVIAHDFNRGVQWMVLMFLGLSFGMLTSSASPLAPLQRRGESPLVNAMRIFVKFFILVSAEFSKPQNCRQLCDSPLHWRVAQWKMDEQVNFLKPTFQLKKKGLTRIYQVRPFSFATRHSPLAIRHSSFLLCPRLHHLLAHRRAEVKRLWAEPYVVGGDVRDVMHVGDGGAIDIHEVF